MIKRCNTGLIKKIKRFIFLILILSGSNSFAQTYEIPDTNLRNRLKRDYAWVMEGDKLNIFSASSYPGALNLSNSNISNTSGLEYFANIWLIDLSFNKLDSFPQLSSLRNLSQVYLQFNQLKTLPDISQLLNLKEFQVQYNQLQALPELNNLTSLNKIYCSDNLLTSFPEINNLVNLTHLVIGNNKVNELPDFSGFINLVQLHIHQTGIDTIKGISNLKNLEIFYAWGNEIRSAKGLDSLEKLRTISLFNNSLTEMPYLNNKPDLSQIELAENYLTFEDLIPLKSDFYFPKLQYTPQKLLTLSPLPFRETTEASLTVTIEHSLQNQYVWYRNNEIIDTTYSASLNFTDLSKENEGDYFVSVSNIQLPGLTLESNIARVSVLPCLELKNLDVNIVDKDCKSGANIDLNNSILEGGSRPFRSTLKGNTSIYTSDNFLFSDIQYGFYSVIITDSKGCEVTSSIFLEKPEDCQEIFTPNGDGYKDTYVIEKPGMIRIYDVNRNLVKEINGPTEWDGTKSDGSPADAGFYAIVTENEDVIRLTLIR